MKVLLLGRILIEWNNVKKNFWPSMAVVGKMLKLDEQYVLASESEDIDVYSFSCGDEDLDEFFLRDAKLYAQNLLGKTYFYVKMTESSVDVVAAFTLANDSVKAETAPM
jgi:hypothetical protein